MKQVIRSILVFAVLVGGLIHCGGNQANGPIGDDFGDGDGLGPDVDVSEDLDGSGTKEAEPAAVKSFTPSDDSTEVSVDFPITVEFTAPASDIEFRVMRKASSDVFSVLEGTHGYNATEMKATFSPDSGLAPNHYYIVTVTWKALPDDEEKQEHTWNFSTITVDSGNGDLEGATPVGGEGGGVVIPDLDLTGNDFGTINGGKGTMKIPSAKDFIDHDKLDLLNDGLLGGQGSKPGKPTVGLDATIHDVPHKLPYKGCPGDPRAYCAPDMHFNAERFERDLQSEVIRTYEPEAVEVVNPLPSRNTRF